MPGFNPFRYRFPYTNLNDINLDWLIKKVRKLSEDVAEINPERMEEVAQQAAAAEQTAQNALETAEGVSGIATDAETIARAAQTTANNAADSAQAAGTAAATAQTTANNAANSAQAAGTAAAAAQTAADAAGTAAAAAQTTANQNRVAIAIVANGDTAPQNISAGQYVIWYGGLYKASTAIASGVTLSNSNLTAVTGGGLNDLRDLMSYFMPSKFIFLDSAHPSFGIPNNCRLFGVILDSDPTYCGLYYFNSTGTGIPVTGQFSNTGLTPDGSQNNVISFTIPASKILVVMLYSTDFSTLINTNVI